jgi:YVTN family beta-propeller protein
MDMVGRLSLVWILLLAAAPARDEKHRSPSDLSLSPDGKWALVANAGSDTLSLVDLDGGRVAAELPAGSRPHSVAWSGATAVVTNLLSDDATVFSVAPPKLESLGTVAVGDEPRGVAISGSLAYVAVSGEDAVVEIDLKTRAVTRRAAAGDEPWHLAVAGDRLAVSCALSQDVRVFNPATLELLFKAPMRGHNLRRVALAPDGQWAYVPNIAERGLGTSRENIDRGWVVGNRLSRVPLREEGPREAMSLDPRGKAVADVEGVAAGDDGLIALAAGGTHELILLRLPLPFVAFGGPGDHMDAALLKDATRFRRIPLGGRPVAAAFAPGGRAVVANWLANALQIVDVEKGEVAKTIALGGPAEPSLVRRGEAVFYDGQRSFNQWFSCHTCHVDGHTNGSTFDTMNDGRYGNLKKTLSLRGVARTGPWTWHGWQTDLRASLVHSMKTTMQGPEPAPADVDALEAYLKTLDFAPPPGKKDAAAARGEALFKARACDACHVPPDYTTDDVFTVGLEERGDKYKGFNPPSLRGVSTRGPWLHDARARTLEDVLQKHHRPQTINGKPDFTPDELQDVIAFLRSL